MAKILRSETSLGQRQHAIRRELRRAGLARLVLWGGVVVASLLLAGVALHRQSVAPLLAIPVFVLLAVGFELRQKEIAVEDRNIEGGRRGEARTAALLAERLADDHLILNDLELRIAHERAQIDHLVLAPSGIYVIESKYWAGTLTGDVHDAQWTQKSHGFPRKVKSPVLQCERQRRMLISLHALRMPEDRIHAMAVFTHPSVHLQIAGGAGRAFLLDEAVRHINDHCFDPPILTPPQLRELADEILRRQP